MPLAVSSAVTWFQKTAGVRDDEVFMNQHFPSMVVKEPTRRLEANAPAPSGPAAFLPQWRPLW